MIGISFMSFLLSEEKQRFFMIRETIKGELFAPVS